MFDQREKHPFLKLVKELIEYLAKQFSEDMLTEQKSGHSCHFEHTLVHSNVMLARIV
jgi:hypothetical protein